MIGPTQINLTICNECEYFKLSAYRGNTQACCIHPKLDHEMYIHDYQFGYVQTRVWCPELKESI